MFLDRIVTMLRRLKPADESGQTLVEYSLIIGLIAIAAITGISLVANNVESLWGSNVSQIGEAVADVLGI